MGIGIFFIIFGYFSITMHKWEGASTRVSMMALPEELPDPPRNWFFTIVGILAVILGLAIIYGVYTGFLKD
jgi:uncharacterized membrane protein YphA (DoxX/SURF4 family)